jgi:hypothetical protein
MAIISTSRQFSKTVVEIASKGVLTRVVEKRLRDCEDKADAIAALRLFGPSADFEIREGDHPIVQAIKETASQYDKIKEAVTPEGQKLANDLLGSILKQLLAWEAVLNNHLALSVRLLVEQARVESNERQRKEESTSEADLLAVINKARNSPANPLDQPIRRLGANVTVAEKDDGDTDGA